MGQAAGGVKTVAFRSAQPLGPYIPGEREREERVSKGKETVGYVPLGAAPQVSWKAEGRPSGDTPLPHQNFKYLWLGLLPRFSYAIPQVLKFAPGDIFVLVTDGFVEWANAEDEEFGAERLTKVIRANCNMPSAKIISELYSEVVKFAGGTPQLDDLTALLVKRV